jgi:hypothetical protein
MIEWTFRILVLVPLFPHAPSFTCRSRAQERPPPFALFRFGPLTHRLSAILGNPSKYRCHFALVTRTCRERSEQGRGGRAWPRDHFIRVLMLTTLTYPTTTQRSHAPPTPLFPAGHEVSRSEAERKRITLCPCHVSLPCHSTLSIQVQEIIGVTTMMRSDSHSRLR